MKEWVKERRKEKGLGEEENEGERKGIRDEWNGRKSEGSEETGR